MKRYYVAFFLMIVTFIGFLWVIVWRSNQSRDYQNKLINLEKKQEEIISENRIINNDINNLLHMEKIIDEAEELGLTPANPDDIIYIIMERNNNGL
ncbi:MAG: hypothetical protein FWH41_00110 [Treponema sp.]|nr:hypothetical protein [Treponema sp.]